MNSPAFTLSTSFVTRRPLQYGVRCHRRPSFIRPAVRLSLSEKVDSLPTVPSPDLQTPLPVRAPASLGVFRDFFSAMNGSWNSERTYHYVRDGGRESSQTTFDVARLSRRAVEAVLESNDESAVFSPQEQAYSEGFNVSFLTKMESQEELVRASTNLAFVPRTVTEAGVVEGDYYRDMGYEESAPVVARFLFDSRKKELNMTTFYTRVVSVDQITLVNARVRIRKIVNYRRPEKEGGPLVDPLLIGFGVETKPPWTKGDSQRLVKG